MKKKIFISLTLFLLIGIASFCLLPNSSKNLLKETVFRNWESRNSTNDNENDLEIEEKESTTIEDKEQNINEEIEENTSTTPSNETEEKELSVAKQETSSHETSVIKNNDKKTEQKPVAEEKQPEPTPVITSTPPKETTPVVETPTCTPEKFDMSYVRADFTTKAECDKKGEEYKKYDQKYGYYCDHYQDDCLTTYYMLTVYNKYTGEEFDFHTIPLP